MFFSQNLTDFVLRSELFSGGLCGVGQGANGADLTCDLPNQGCFSDNMNAAPNNDGNDACQCNAGAEAQAMAAPNAALMECVLSLGKMLFT